jgi:hypothetical protein
MPMMITTTMISIRVNPRWRLEWRQCLDVLLTMYSRCFAIPRRTKGLVEIDSLSV